MKYKNINEEYRTMRTTIGLTSQDWKSFTDCLIKANTIQLAMMNTMIEDEDARRKEMIK